MRALNLFVRVTGLSVAVLALLACDRPDLESQQGRYSYAVGYQIARNVKAQGVKLDAKSFNAAVKDVMEGKESKLSDKELAEALKAAAESGQKERQAESEANLAKAEKYLADNRGKPGVVTTDSGLQYKVLEEGKGSKPKPDDIVEVHYKGTLIDGTEFDSSYSRNSPAQFPVKAVIPGWTEALQLMTVGSKYQLFIPAELAYGPQGNPKIPGNSALIFEVELLKIVK